MIIGIPKEIKNHEYRVGIIPANVSELTSNGHDVIVESDAGKAIGFSNQDYIHAGATITTNAAEVFSSADMIVKVKEPQANERVMLRKDQILFTYLHLAPDFSQTQDLINSKAVCIAYETITDPLGRLPLLAPMSEVAGRMAIQAGAFALEKSNGGAGLLLSGVAGVAAANVVILGGGVVGANAARLAVGMRANVTLIDKNIQLLRQLDSEFQGRINLVASSEAMIEYYVTQADLVIGAVLVPGANAPRLVSAELIKKMKSGSAIVDVAIDQGGCIETSKPTTHDNPTYIVDDVVHYCVANMPGAVARTATLALNNASFPYILKLANHGYQDVLASDPHFRRGANIIHGHITNEAVAAAFNLPFIDPLSLLATS